MKQNKDVLSQNFFYCEASARSSAPSNSFNIHVDSSTCECDSKKKCLLV